MAKREPVIIGGMARRSVTEVVDLLGVDSDGIMHAAIYYERKGEHALKKFREAAELGARTHKWFERHWKKQPQPTEVDPFDDGTWEDGKHLFGLVKTQWIDKHCDKAFEALAVEKKIICEDIDGSGLGCHGTADLIAGEVQNGELIASINDLKTSTTTAPKFAHWVQQARYVLMEESFSFPIDLVRIITVNKKNEKVYLHTKSRQEMQQFCDVFMSLLKIAYTLDEMGIKHKKREIGE